MKTLILPLSILLLIPALMLGQINDPEVIASYSSMPSTIEGTGNYQIELANNGFEDIVVKPSDKFNIAISFNKSVIENISKPSESVTGTAASLFSWQYVESSNILFGILTSPILAGSSYDLSIAVKVTESSTANDVGFLARIVPSFGVNKLGNNTGNDAASAYTNAEVSSLSNLDDGLVDLEIYPNPTRNTINLYSNNFTNTVKLSMFTVLGQQILSSQQTPVAGKVSVDISKLSIGTYFINVNSNGFTATKKIIKK